MSKHFQTSGKQFNEQIKYLFSHLSNNIYLSLINTWTYYLSFHRTLIQYFAISLNKRIQIHIYINYANTCLFTHFVQQMLLRTYLINFKIFLYYFPITIEVIGKYPMFYIKGINIKVLGKFYSVDKLSLCFRW